MHKGEKLATFFSNELIKAQQAYFFSLQAFESAKAGKRPNDIRQAEDGVHANEKILMSMGMGEPQTHQVAQKRVATRRHQNRGSRGWHGGGPKPGPAAKAEPGTEIFRIVDLSRVWVFTSVLPGEMPFLKPGARARIVIPRTGRTLQAVMIPRCR